MQGSILQPGRQSPNGFELKKQKDLTGAFQYVKGASKEARDGLFTRACSDRIRMALSHEGGQV